MALASRGIHVRLKVFCLSLFLGVAPGVLAHAQQGQSPFARDRNQSVTERRRPEYDAAGLRAGAFFVYPKIVGNVEYQDNVFASETNTLSDTVATLTPSVDVESGWSRHQLRGSAMLNTYRYSKYSSENNTSYAVEGSGRLDVVRGSSLRASAAYEHDIESRQSVNVQQFSSSPTEYNVTKGSVGGTHEFNRIRIIGDVNVADFKYDNPTDFSGKPIDISYRDHTNTEERVRVDYALSPALALFATVTHNDRSFNSPTQVGDVKRDSKGWEGGLGADFDVTAVARGQVQLGYISQKYDDPRIHDSTGLGVRTKLEWFPNGLTTVTFVGERSVDDTGLIGAAGVLASRADIRVDHELLRNLLVTGRAHWNKDEYRGLDRNDTEYGALATATYLLSRRVGVFGTYDYVDRKSDGLQRGHDFNASRVQFGVVLQY